MFVCETLTMKGDKKVIQLLNKLLIGENVPECLAGDLKLEIGAHADLKTAIAHCRRSRISNRHTP